MTVDCQNSHPIHNVYNMNSVSLNDMLNYPFFDDLIMLRNDMLNYQSYSLMSDLIMLRNVGRYQRDNQKP
jgi:hypothetical protein